MNAETKPATSSGRSDDVPWIPFEDRRRARDAKRDAVLRMAVKMFLEEGYHRTALTEVATRLNITKPALYNYFRGKEEILFECFRLGCDMYDVSIRRIEQQDGCGLDKLGELIRAYVHVVTQDFGMCIVRLDDRELGDAQRAQIRAEKRRYDEAFRKQIMRGIEDGSIMPCDPKLATFIIVGALNAISNWYRADGKMSVEAIAETFARQLTEGLRRHG